MSSSTDSFKTVDLDGTDFESILDELDASIAKPAKEARAFTRYLYRNYTCVIALTYPGSAAPVRYLAPTRNLSVRGLSFLHGGFLHTGTRCVVHLASKQGAWDAEEATVVWCRHVEENIHEVAVCFAQDIDPKRYCEPLPKKRLLIAEDDVSIVSMLQASEDQLNAEISHAVHGRIAVEMALQDRYDLILMDMEMPVLDGLSAVKELRSRGYSGPIIATTGRSDAATRQHCLQVGCSGFLPKPYSLSALARVLSSLDMETGSRQENESVVAEAADPPCDGNDCE